jgi:small conductance mechanosensitive channel
VVPIVALVPSAPDDPEPVDPDLVDACGGDPNGICEWTYETTGNEFLSKLADWLIGRPLTILLILLVAWILTRLERRYLRRAVERMLAPDRDSARRRAEQFGLQKIDRLRGADDPRREARAKSMSNVLGSVATVVTWSIALIMVLGELGVALGPLIAGAGLAGAALGFGAQSLVKDFLSGIFMLLEDQYGIGDVIDVGEAIGTVDEFALRTTVLRSLDGTVWHVPNGEIRRVGNMSQLWSVALVDVDVAYDADLEQVQTLLRRTAEEVCADEEWAADVLEPPQVLGVENLGADGITMRMVVKTTPGSQWALQRTLRQRLKDTFDREGVEIPFPQRTIWLRDGGGEG